MRRESVLFARIPETGHQNMADYFFLPFSLGGGFFVLLALLDDLGSATAAPASGVAATAPSTGATTSSARMATSEQSRLRGR